MNVGFSLDEGNATPDNILPVFYGERYIWSMRLLKNKLFSVSHIL